MQVGKRKTTERQKQRLTLEKKASQYCQKEGRKATDGGKEEARKGNKKSR